MSRNGALVARCTDLSSHDRRLIAVRSCCFVENAAITVSSSRTGRVVDSLGDVYDEAKQHAKDDTDRDCLVDSDT